MSLLLMIEFFTTPAKNLKFANKKPITYLNSIKKSYRTKYAILNGSDRLYYVLLNVFTDCIMYSLMYLFTIIYLCILLATCYS